MNTKNSNFWAELEDKEFAHGYADEFLNILIATQIKVLRGDLTQAQLAERAGMAQERISLLENINYSSWSVNTLRKLANAFDLRLRVTFENFSTLIYDIQRLNVNGLKRKPRELELREFSEGHAATSYAIEALNAVMPSVDANTQRALASVAPLPTQTYLHQPYYENMGGTAKASTGALSNRAGTQRQQNPRGMI